MLKYPSNITSQKGYLYLITLAYSLGTFASGILVPIYAFFVQEIGGGLLETSYAIALYSIILGIATMVVHQTTWSHKYPLVFLCVGWFLWLMSMAMYLIMRSTDMLYVSQIVNGIGDAMSEPIFDAEFSREASDDLAGGWALYQGATSIFSGVASMVGGVIATMWGFNALLYCVIAVGTTSFFLIVHYSLQKQRSLQRVAEKIQV